MSDSTWVFDSLRSLISSSSCLISSSFSIPRQEHKLTYNLKCNLKTQLSLNTSVTLSWCLVVNTAKWYQCRWMRMLFCWGCYNSFTYDVPLLARCLIVSISTPDIRAFFMAEVARGQPERLERKTHISILLTEIIYASYNPWNGICPPFTHTSGGWENCHWHGLSHHTQVWGMSCHQFSQTSMETELHSRNHPSDAWQPAGSRMHCDETHTSLSHDPDHHTQAQDTCNKGLT